jgi:hypothetical protein
MPSVPGGWCAGLSKKSSADLRRDSEQPPAIVVTYMPYSGGIFFVTSSK